MWHETILPTLGRPGGCKYGHSGRTSEGFPKAFWVHVGIQSCSLSESSVKITFQLAFAILVGFWIENCTWKMDLCAFRVSSIKFLRKLSFRQGASMPDNRVVEAERTSKISLKRWFERFFGLKQLTVDSGVGPTGLSHRNVLILCSQRRGHRNLGVP